jgi:CDP-glucose 4,6-dehydratase
MGERRRAVDQMEPMNEIAPGYRFGGFWKDRSVLVTGAAGFIGSALASELIRLDAFVSTLDVHDPQGMTYPVDLADYHATLRAVLDCQPEVIFHLAAASQVTAAASAPLLTVQDNIVATANLLEAARSYSGMTNVVVASSDKAYGPQPDEKLAENSALKPVHIYDTTKAAADLLAQCYGEFYHLPLAITRMANVYGPGDTNWRRLVPSVLLAWLRDMPPMLRSDGNQIREYVYIGDAVLGLLAVGRYRMETAMATRAMIFNLGSWHRHSANELLPIIRDVVKAVLPHATCPEPIVLGGARDETSAILLDSLEAFARLGWKATTVPGFGILQTALWLRDRLGLWIAADEPEGL